LRPQAGELVKMGVQGEAVVEDSRAKRNLADPEALEGSHRQ
jgi:hypothetical protein